MNVVPVTKFILRPQGDGSRGKKDVTNHSTALSFLAVWIVLALHG